MNAPLTLGLGLVMTSQAFAGGMVLPIRGVRALERSGALVAGADDADALWLDPAGLGHLAGDGSKAFLFDAAYVDQPVDYSRIDSAGNMQPTVSNQHRGGVSPTIAAAIGIGDRLVIAGGIAEPYSALHNYDDTGPQRYASTSNAGTTVVIVAVGAGYVVNDKLRVGATVQDTVSSIHERLVVSDCPGQTTCALEDRTFDAVTQLDAADYFAPTGSLGVQYDAARELTLGGTVQAPTWVSASGKLQTELPTSSSFAGAVIAGDSATTSYWLPPSVRAGIEWHPSRALRIEAAVDVELWSIHDKISIAPHGVTITTPGAMYTLGTMTIPRDYKTSYAPAIGIEYRIGEVMLGAGLSYETAAAPKADVSVLTVDSSKILVGLGGGYEAEGWQIGAAAGFVALADVDVPLADAKVAQLQPIHDAAAPVSANAGAYHSSYLLAGIRAARRF